MQFKTSITIDQPVGKVYKYVLEPRNMKAWMQGFKSYKPRKGRHRAAGSIAVQVFEEPDGKPTKVEEEVLLLEKNQEIRLRLSHQNMQSTIRYRFLDQGGQTKLLVEVKTRLRPLLFNLFAPFVKGPMKRRQESDLQRLKHEMEKNG